MRILHVVHQYLPDYVGGTELYTRMLAQALTRRGHTSAVFTPAPQLNDTITREEAVAVYRAGVGERSASAVFLSTFREPDLLATFDGVLSAEMPDLVHIQHLMGLPAALVDHIRERDIPVVVTLHDYWHLCANAQLITNYDNTICEGPKAWLNCGRCALARAGHDLWPLAPAVAPLMAVRQAKLRHVLDRAAAIVSPTHFTRDIHTQMGISAERIRTIPHGIDVPADLPPRVAHDDFHIGYVGGIAWQKGIDVLIEAMNRFSAEVPVRLTVVGDMGAFPDYADHLRQMATHPGINFVGRIPHEHLWQTLADMDVVVVPTLWYETSSLIVQEAHAAGVPVVASQIGALGEKVRDGMDGRFFPVGDAAALFDILQELAGNSAEMERLRAGIGPVRTLSEHVDDIEALYGRVV